ncbi:hypothetical protein K0M31_007370 [Melipona bicolor]|uniref:Uncharacterized protein n=1 Tax=Melipona bicolor TaxID=60889 RepID=A0AA40GBA0_9HYME|nr:hypothetical protein K0M31_007370 [Melipona bicolor]
MLADNEESMNPVFRLVFTLLWLGSTLTHRFVQAGKDVWKTSDEASVERIAGPDPREYFHDDEREQPGMYHRRVYVRAKTREQNRESFFNRRGPETGRIMVSYLRSTRHRGALACKADRWLNVLELTSQDIQVFGISLICPTS